MENILLNAFSEHLSKIIVGFRRDQINSSLLTGRGEIKSVDLNCDILNDILRSYTLGLAELESVHVTRLGFNVTSFTNIKKAPIEVIIDEVHVRMVEPLHYKPPRKSSSEPSTSSGADANGTNSSVGIKRPYGLFDRIGDNITVEINRIFFTFQPLGKFKTRRTGPWTPPALGLTLRSFRYVSVDEFGEEGTPEQVWRHNDRDRRMKRANGRPQDIFIYKKLTLNCSLGLRPAALEEDGSIKSGAKPSTKLLLRSVPVVVDITMQKRKMDAAFLAAQSDVSINNVDVELDDHAVPLLAHMFAAVRHLVVRDRSFVDPLKPDGNGDNNDGSDGSTDAGAGMSMMLDESIEMTLDEDDGDKSGLKAKLAEKQDERNDHDGDEDDEASSSSDEEEEEANYDAVESSESAVISEAAEMPSGPDGKRFHPAYIFQSGITILNRISLSLTVHNCTVRAWYPTSLQGGGYLQCDLQGLVTEAIWPPRPGERGGIGQVSLSYISLQERHGKALLSMLVGGKQRQISTEKVPGGNDGGQDMMSAEPEISFPLFEERSIRTDGYDTRKSAPSQTIGLKCTIDIQRQRHGPNEGKMQMSFLNEVGLDRFDVNLDSNAFCRALSFCLNGEEGFDERWYDGNWAEWLSNDMFASPSKAGGGIPSLEPYLQSLPEVFLDENHLISSDLFNLTSKLTSIRLRLPAPVQEDVKSSDAMIELSNMMVLISSVLPKTHLSGRTCPSEEDCGPEKYELFPNDPSDISANLARIDEMISGGHEIATMRSSTFRVQFNIDGFSVRAIPAIPLLDAKECQTIIAPAKISSLICLDVSAPPSAHTRKGMGIAAHVSLSLPKLQVNIDFDILSGLASTILYHSGAFLDKSKASDATRKDETVSSSLDKVLKSQVSQSFESGIVAFLLQIDLPDTDLQIWRQECTINTPTQCTIPVLLLARIRLKGFQIGAEFAKGFHLENTDCSKLRLLVKAGMSAMVIDLCEPSLLDSPKETRMDVSAGKSDEVDDSNELEERVQHRLRSTSELLTLGNIDPDSQADQNAENFIRFDYDGDVVTCAVALESAGSLQLKLDAVDLFIAQAIEALFIPTGIHNTSSSDDKNRANTFPAGSLGYVFETMLSNKGEQDVKFASSPGDGVSSSSLIRSIQSFAVHLSLSHFALAVPTSTNDSISKPLYYSLQLSKSTVTLGYFQTETAASSSLGATRDSWQQRCSGNKQAWTSLFKDYAPGLHLYFNSHQSISHSADPLKELIVLVPPFGVDGLYHPTNAILNMGKLGLTFEEMQVLQRLSDSISSLVKKGYKIFAHISSLNSLIQCKSEDEHHNGSTSGNSNAARIASREALISLSSAEEMLAHIEKDLVSRKEKAFIISREKTCELDRLKFLLYLKEKQRTAALSLVSARVCGFIRMGSGNVSGQRIITTTSLWRYWAIVRKNLLIVTERPGASKPIDIIPLKDVSLHCISGNNKRTELHRGFALIDSNGYERFFSCSTGVEYEMWMKALSNIVKVAPPEMSAPVSSSDPSNSTTNAAAEKQYDNTNSGIPVPAPDEAEVESSVSNVATTSSNATEESPLDANVSVRPDSTAISSSMTTSRSSESESIVSPAEATTAGEGNQRFKNKLSVVKDTTKLRLGETSSRFGAAVQSQRGGRFMQKMAEAKASANAKLGEAAAAAAAEARAAAARAAAARAASEIQTGGHSPNSERRTGRRIAGMKASITTASTTSSPPREVSHAVQSSAGADEMMGEMLQPDLNTSDMSLGDDSSLGGDNQMRRKLGERMSRLKSDGSKIQSVMKSRIQSVKLDGQALARLNSSSFQSRENAGSGFGGVETHPPSLRIKSLRSLPRGPIVKQEDLPVVELKRIPGKWHFNVEMVRSIANEKTTDDVAGTTVELTADSSAHSSAEAAEADKNGDNADTNGDNADASALASKPFPWVYEVSFECINGAGPSSKSSCTKDLSEILEYYTNISSSINSVQGYDEEYEANGHDMLELSSATAAFCSQLAATSRILDGVIDLNGEVLEHEDVRAYQCEILSTFFDSVHASPLPESAISSTADFFDSNTNGPGLYDSAPLSMKDLIVPIPSIKAKQEPTPHPDLDLATIEKLVSACKSTIASASRMSLLALNVAESSLPSETTNSFVDASTPWSHFMRNGDKRDAMQTASLHEALVSAMAERDEAHAQLLASSVLHVNEMDTERKKIDRLTRKLVVAEKLNAEANAGGSFILGSDEISSSKDSILKQEREMMRNTEEELLAMCRQLSSEISEKTSASLEVVRIKEGHRIEREAEKARRDEMQDEIALLRKQLAEEKAKSSNAQRNASQWKASFDKAINASSSSASTMIEDDK